LGGRSCLPNGDCTPLCPALPLTKGIFEGARIWNYSDAATPRWLRVDNTRGILHAATSDHSTAFIEFVKNPLTNTDIAGTCDTGSAADRFFFFVDYEGGTYRFSLAGTGADLAAAGFGNAGDNSLALTSDGNTLVGVNAARTAFLQRTRSSARGAATVTWTQVMAAPFGSMTGSNLSRPVFAPNDTLFFYAQQPAAQIMQMRSARAADGSYPNGVDVSLQTTFGGTLHMVDSVSADLLTLLAVTPNDPPVTRVFSRPHRWAAFGPVGASGDTVSGFRSRLNADCTAAITTCEGGCGNERVCIMPMRGCAAETDMEMCTRLGANCTVTAQDLCYRSRTINCGTCSGSNVCSRGGRCTERVPDGPLVFTPSNPSPDTAGVYEVKLYLPQPGGTDQLIDERFFLLGATADGETLLVYRGCNATSADYFFADRFDPVNYRYRLTRIASGTEPSNAGLAVGDTVMALAPDGLAFVTANAPRTSFVRWARAGKGMSLSFTPEGVRVLDGFISVGAGQNIAFPAFTSDGRFFSYTQESPSRRVFFGESTVGGFLRDSATEITASLTVTATTYAPTGISPDGLTLFTTNGTQTFLFSRPSLSGPIGSAFSPIGSPEAFVGNYSRPTLRGGNETFNGKIFAMRAAVMCVDERIVVNTISPNI
jgi:hypothetical protein